MSEFCENCEILDIASLLDESKEIDPDLAKRLIRYYCRNPESDYDYCPYHGQKDKCIYQKMLAFNEKVLK